jgi:hypothetical protein
MNFSTDSFEFSENKHQVTFSIEKWYAFLENKEGGMVSPLLIFDKKIFLK